jgi:hypothetical protein
MQTLLGQNVLTGIDFVYVHKDQVTLDVYFLVEPNLLQTPLIAPPNPAPDLRLDQVQIDCPAGDTPLTEIPIVSMIGVLIGDEPRCVLRLTTQMPGDFTTYRLTIDDWRIDNYYNGIAFSFKANCPSDLDCKPAAHECPPEPQVDFPVDYQARDFWSFRRALLDFATQRYPNWREQIEADAGVMLAEVLSAVGDELAYYQDRVAREAYLETATQRRSLRRHARLIDYDIYDGLGATAWLDVTAQGQATLPAGMNVWALSDNGTRIDFEVGHGLSDAAEGGSYDVDSALNSLDAYVWDANATCLGVGATEVYVGGQNAAALSLNDPSDVANQNRWVLLKTNPQDPSVPERTLVVQLIEVSDEVDPLFGEPVTHLKWAQAQALPFEMDMETLEVHCNLVPVTAGKTQEVLFVTGEPGDEAANLLPRAVERQGPQASAETSCSCADAGDDTATSAETQAPVIYLFSLPGSDSQQLVWLGEDVWHGQPEILLEQMEYEDGGWQVNAEVRHWNWKSAFLGSPSSEPQDQDYILDDGTWTRVVGYQRDGNLIVHMDYASGDGKTIRFGDGEFGLIPAAGTVFRARYRLGGGSVGNVPDGAIVNFDQGGLSVIESITNPLPASGGQDPQTAMEIRQLAPEAFQAVTYRAVRPEDYAEAAEQLAWVQRAGATLRWTGSWLSMFVTPDPEGSVVLSDDERTALQEQLDRYRQAGRETNLMDPNYVGIDLQIQICVATGAYPGDVQQRVLDALMGTTGVNSQPGFFSPDNFTFGTSLLRSKLEATIQAVTGVQAVNSVLIRSRGRFDWRVFSELCFSVAADEIICLENDPLHPGRGSLNLIMRGGA